MTLTSLEISQLRNISQAKLALSPGFNLIHGPNGSGKTSLLEAASLLFTARSFRNSNLAQVIQHEADACLVRGEMTQAGQQYRIGLQRDRNGNRDIRINEETVKKGSELARLLPVLVLAPDSVDLLLGPPANRRRFLNWGVFHVKHQFGRLWEEATRSLMQRNRLLRQGRPADAEMRVWTDQLVEQAEAVDEARASYVADYEPIFAEVAEKIAGISDIQLQYDRGWGVDQPLTVVYESQLDDDLKKGYTQHGFQRADVKINISGQSADKICSRGELKSLVWAMILAQGRLAKSGHQQHGLYLVDDLAAEFDAEHRQRVCEYLLDTGEQVLLTGMEREVLEVACGGQFKAMFHVKHGQVFQEI